MNNNIIDKNIEIIIPTRNRHHLLMDLISRIQSQTKLPKRIIIIDSSDEAMSPQVFTSYKLNVEYIHVNIKSTAQQKNIGLEKLDENTRIVIFLDDDVIPDTDYVEKLAFTLENYQLTGVSGIALSQIRSNNRTRPSGLIGILKIFFLLDSKEDGKLLSSGINIPVRVTDGPIIEVDWLIGCSAWKWEDVSDLRFEKSFSGQSLGEDVIYSVRAKERGIIAVNPNIHLPHLESEIERPFAQEFWKMWVINRYRMLLIFKGSKMSFLNYHWANFGQFFNLILKQSLQRKISFKSNLGIIQGYLEIMNKNVK